MSSPVQATYLHFTCMNKGVYITNVRLVNSHNSCLYMCTYTHSHPSSMKVYTYDHHIPSISEYQWPCIPMQDLMARIELSLSAFKRHCQVICWLHCEFTSCRQQANEAGKLLAGLLAPWWDAKWKAGETHAVCYHSICLKPQTGHYPAIILADLQSQRMRQLLWLVQSPGGEIGTSL